MVRVRTEAERERDIQIRRQRRLDLDAVKMARGGCENILPDGTRCGYNRHPAALDWDHVGEKQHQYLQAFHPAWKWSRIMAEIAKCELVCSNCHRIRTAERGYRGGSPTHGKKRTRMVTDLGGRPRTLIDDDLLRRLHAEGTSVAAAARHLDVSGRVVWLALRRLGLVKDLRTEPR